MARLVRAVFAATVTAAVVGALAGCNFFGPVERVSDQTTISEDIATIQLADPTGSVTVRGGATEAVVKRPVVVTDEHGDDSIAIRHMTYLCMSWDHRALDGALAAQFLAALRAKLEG